MTLAGAATWAWYAPSAPAGFVRAALSPLSAAFGLVVSARNRRYDRGDGIMPVALPAISVGNLTVGGTGKTPVAAWCAAELRARGGNPSLVMRGYGDDEWRVHGLLNPGIAVVADADRVRGIAAASKAGADCVVLDDAFQHRRAARVADLVLLSADAWTGTTPLLPSGPWREPLAALQRASAVVITVKGAHGESQLEAVHRAIAAAAPRVPVAVVRLVAGALRAVAAGERITALVGAEQPLSSLHGRAVTAVSAIADPASFEASIASAGAHVTGRRYPDHHEFLPDDVRQIIGDVDASAQIVCTLKDAVKLAPLWPRAAPPLWYVSQTIEVRLGLDVLHSALDRVLAARLLPHAASRPNAG